MMDGMYYMYTLVARAKMHQYCALWQEIGCRLATTGIAFEDIVTAQVQLRLHKQEI